MCVTFDQHRRALITLVLDIMQSLPSVKFLLIGNIPSILHGTYHTQTKPYNIPCPKNRKNFVGGGRLRMYGIVRHEK